MVVCLFVMEPNIKINNLEEFSPAHNADENSKLNFEL